jgi:hypothetical protein
MFIFVIGDIFVSSLTESVCLECDIHIVIYSKYLICKIQQLYIFLKKLLVVTSGLFVFIRHVKGTF